MKRILCLVFVSAAFFAVSCGGGSSNGTSSVVPVCGNGKIEAEIGEVCDGDVSCGEAGHFYPEGTAKCKSDCSAYDTSSCIARPAGDKCGNGQIDSGESCEQGDTKSCKEISNTFASGEAGCRRDCLGWELTNCKNGGTDTCAQILSCVQGCSGDATCESNCKNAGSEDGKQGYSALESCAAACGGVADKECLAKNCYEAYYNCNPNMKCGNGVIDDGEICENKETKPCEELDPEKWQPINEAVCNSECKGWDTYSCIDINSLTCMQLYDCTKECTDSECEQACFAKTSSPAKAKYDTMKQCLADNTCAVDEECMSGVCKFQTDACKTYLTCGNKVVDKDMGEVCDKGEAAMKDCGEFKDENGVAIYEAETGSAFCGPNCTEYDFTMCYKFCSCAEVQTCIETECGGYPASNAENTDEKKKCMDECENWGSQVGSKQASAYRELVESCSEQNGPSAWDSDGCKKDFPAQYDWTCDSGDDSRCPY